MIAKSRTSVFGVPLLALLAGCAALLIVEEARVSEVSYEDSNQSIEDMVSLSQHVVVVDAKALNPSFVIKKHVWPKSTHY